MIKRKYGFTLVELMVVLGIMLIMFSIATVSLTSLQNKTNVATTMNTLISDIKLQQLKAMTGDTDGKTTANSYGIHFDTNKYVLFSGTVYSSTNSANFAINLDQNETFTTVGFTGANLIFSQVSGEILNYVNGAGSITLKNISTNDQKTVQLNKYGIITQLN